MAAGAYDPNNVSSSTVLPPTIVALQTKLHSMSQMVHSVLHDPPASLHTQPASVSLALYDAPLEHSWAAGPLSQSQQGPGGAADDMQFLDQTFSRMSRTLADMSMLPGDASAADVSGVRTGYHPDLWQAKYAR